MEKICTFKTATNHAPNVAHNAQKPLRGIGILRVLMTEIWLLNKTLRFKTISENLRTEFPTRLDFKLLWKYWKQITQHDGGL